MTTATERNQPGDAPVLDPLLADLTAATQLRNLAKLRRGLEHELRSPLNAVVLNVELLKELTRAAGTETAVVQLERLDLIGNAVERLQSGIAELMNQLERPDPVAGVFDFGELVVDAQTAVRSELRQRGVALEVETTPEPVFVSGRRDYLRLAVISVLLNALEASPRDRRVSLECRVDDQQVVLDVRDQGPGIDPEIRSQIFDRHFSTKTGCSGIGLHVARELIEADGGTLELTASGPDGTAFTLRLPETSP